MRQRHVCIYAAQSGTRQGLASVTASSSAMQNENATCQSRRSATVLHSATLPDKIASPGKVDLR